MCEVGGMYVGGRWLCVCVCVCGSQRGLGLAIPRQCLGKLPLNRMATVISLTSLSGQATY